MSYYLSHSGQKLREQIDNRWPKRDKASDGWIGDASHQAVPSDHNPDYDDGGVVRAIDIDANLDKEDKTAAQRLANQLIEYARKGKDNGRLSYVIYNGWIASGTYASVYWHWRDYDGSDPHTSHIHVSFTPKGDKRDGAFRLDIFKGRLRRKLRAIKENLVERRNALTKKIKNLAERLRRL